jgi:peroxiredoxin
MGIRRFALVAALFLVASSALAAPRSPRPGERLPSFILQDQEGKLRKAESLCADRPLALSFFAANCPACRKELPILQRIHAEQGGRIRVVLVLLDPEGLRVFAPFKEELGITFTVLDGSGGVLQDQLGIDSLPRVMLVGQGGVIKEILIGFDPGKSGEFEAKILKLAGEGRRQPDPPSPIPNPEPFPSW